MAIFNMIGGGTSSGGITGTAGTGYMRLGIGTTAYEKKQICWGTVNTPASATSSVSVTFAKAFSAVPTVTATAQTSNSGTTPTDATVYIESVSKTGCYLKVQNIGNLSTIHWVAIGGYS